MKKIILSLLCHVGLIAFAQEFSQRYELVNLGKEINTFYHEAAPVVSPDGKTLYFFVQNHPQNKFGRRARKQCKGFFNSISFRHLAGVGNTGI